MKICVYAIAKNEIKFIDRWFNSVKEADYICVLDTGSTDGEGQRYADRSKSDQADQQIYNCHIFSPFAYCSSFLKEDAGAAAVIKPLITMQSAQITPHSGIRPYI